MDVCWLCQVSKEQHHSKDHQFSSLNDAIRMAEFAIEIGGLIEKMEAHRHVDLPSKMPIQNHHYGEGKVN